MALHHQKIALDFAHPADFQARHQALQGQLAGFGHLAQVAEAVAFPVGPELRQAAVVAPLRVIAHAGHAHKQIHVAHYFGESQRRHPGQRHRRVVAREAHLVGTHVVVDAGVIPLAIGLHLAHPVLSREAVGGQRQAGRF
nr:hypothetical protein [Tanacetum cinerariifolium]